MDAALPCPAFGYESSGRGLVPEAAAFTSWSGLGGALRELLLTGAYPLATYFPYVLAGMALARLCDVRERAVAGRMAGGAAAAVAGYGSARLAAHVFGARTARIAFSAAALTVTWVWHRVHADGPLRRGPLEHALRPATRPRSRS
ncbi:hypothetical protein ACGFYQ_20010 [Streptomyces sp. NPDC048258]|uniref:hypothetical protein n=1 Tax=Streptomyces sp. NPDC048258 TaxID=3365527 RepID=UPI003713B9A8